jgi:hypothetical protein
MFPRIEGLRLHFINNHEPGDFSALAASSNLWDKPADFDASRFDDLMNSLCVLAEARNITWMGAVRLDASFVNDPAKGWRLGALSFLHSALSFDDAAQEQTEKLELGNVDENIIRNLDGAGSFRANRLQDLAGPE